MTSLTPKQTAAADQFYAATTHALDGMLTKAKVEYDRLRLADSLLIAALATELRKQVKSNPDGVAAMLAVAVVRLVKEQK